MNQLEGVPYAISIRQPWAWLVAAGWKDIENRSQHFNYRGAIAIHASKQADEAIYRPVQLLRATLSAQPDAARSAEYVDHNLGRFYEESADLRSFGSIIAVATIIACVHEDDTTRARRSRWYTGPHGLMMHRPVLLDEPIPWRGRLGIWKLKESDRVSTG